MKYFVSFCWFIVSLLCTFVMSVTHNGSNTGKTQTAPVRKKTDT